MRSNQNKNNNNNNRNRNRNNNRRNTGGGGGGPNNKVYDSNGPDIKLRGTTQTVAEKYMQLGRDAQSSGDTVAAENYYQHAEHYYRLWAASQPVGHSLQMPRKLGEDEFDDDGDDQGGEDEGENVAADVAQTEAAPALEGAPSEVAGEGQQPRQNRNPNYRDNNNRDQNGRNFRPRWQNNRNNRNFESRDGQPMADQNGAPSVEAGVEVAQPQPAPVAVADHEGQWEAPSFLQRPSPVVVDEAPMVADEPVARKPRTRRPRAEAEKPVDDSSSAAE